VLADAEIVETAKVIVAGPLVVMPPLPASPETANVTLPGPAAIGAMPEPLIADTTSVTAPVPMIG
jgi:hypothetical protein